MSEPIIDAKQTAFEDHIDILRALDEQRRTSARLREHGVTVLGKWIQDIPTKLTQAKTNDEFFDLIRFAVIAVDVLYRCCKRPPEGLERQLDQLVGYLEQDRTPPGGVELNGPPATPYPIFLDNLSSDRMSLLLAAELMQTLAAAPKHVYSTATLLSYYWIARELYTADAPDWSIGGARAASDGRVSAFVTNKCVLSVVRFAHAQECTARFIDCLCAFKEESQRLENVRTFPNLPDAYKRMESQRLRFSCYIALQRYGKTLALPFKKPHSPDTLVDDLDAIFRDLAGTVADVEKSFAEAVAEIVHFRTQEWTRIDAIPDEGDRKQQKRKFHRSAFGHERARLALQEGLEKTQEIRKLVDADPAPDGLKILKKISSELRDAAERVQQMLRPCHTYLNSVLDRELAAISLGSDSTWEPHEMAFAAASLAILEKRWREDRRLREALLQLSSTMTDRGRFPYVRPFHWTKGELELVFPASVLRACAELARCVSDSPVDLGIVTKMLRYFRKPG